MISFLSRNADGLALWAAVFILLGGYLTLTFALARALRAIRKNYRRMS